MIKKERYSENELQEFKRIILKKLEITEIAYEKISETINNGSSNNTDDTWSQFKPYEESSDISSKEINSTLAVRLEKFIRDLKLALERIENKTYGICRETGKLIEKERLLLVPHATLSMEAKLKTKNEQ